MKGVSTKPRYHKPGFWTEDPCYGCKKKLNSTDETQRLCPDCYEAMLEGLAVRLDTSYDRTKMNEGPDCWRILRRLYTRWNWLTPGYLDPEI